MAHANVTFLGTVATIKADCPFSNCSVSFDAAVWSPQIGMQLCMRLVASSNPRQTNASFTFMNYSGEGQPLFTRSCIAPRS